MTISSEESGALGPLVEYTDLDGTKRIIPQSFKEILDYIDQHEKTPEFLEEINKFRVKLENLVAKKKGERLNNDYSKGTTK